MFANRHSAALVLLYVGAVISLVFGLFLATGQLQAAGTAQVTITVLPNPAGSDAEGEYVEFTYVGPLDIPINDFRMSNSGGSSIDYDFPDATLSSGDTFRVCAPANTDSQCDDTWSSGSLTNGGDSVTVNLDGVSVITHTFSFGAASDNQTFTETVMVLLADDQLATCDVYDTGYTQESYAAEAIVDKDIPTDSIVPPFYYFVSLDNFGYFDGQNWGDSGEAIYQDDCVTDVPETGGDTDSDDTAATGTAKVSGQVYHDINNNGVWDPSEPLLSGIEVCAENLEDNHVHCTTTNELGYYVFHDAEAVDCRIYQNITAPWQQTTPLNPSYCDVLNPVPGEEYYCDFGNYSPQTSCLDGVEMRIVRNAGDAAGAGQANDQVLLGDGSIYNYSEWFSLTSDTVGTFITDPNVATDFPNQDTENGLFVSRNGDGTVTIALVGNHQPGGNTNHEWLDITVEVRNAAMAAVTPLPNDFKLENHNNSDVPSNDGFDRLENVTAHSFDLKMWVDTVSDGVLVSIDQQSLVICEEPPVDQEPETFAISGYKWSDENGDGVWDESEGGIADWTIYLESEATTTATTTRSDGYYEFTVPAGWYEVYEEQRTDWVQTAPTTTEYQFSSERVYEEEPMFGSCSYHFYEEDTPQGVFRLVDDGYSLYNPESCDFGNQYVGTSTQPEPEDEDDEETNTSGGGSGSFFGSRNTEPEGRVLGATTSSYCPFLIDHMQIGWENNSWEVIKLQLFLSMVMNYDNPITGTFDAVTDANVKRFQAAYAAEVLTPWFTAGIVSHQNPTGFVYKTTKWKINDLVCPGTPFPSLEGEDLSTNIDLD